MSIDDGFAFSLGNLKIYVFLSKEEGWSQHALGQGGVSQHTPGWECIIVCTWGVWMEGYVDRRVCGQRGCEREGEQGVVDRGWFGVDRGSFQA